MEIEAFLNQVIEGNCLEVLKQIPSNSIDVVITSPPYFQQRDYGNGNQGIGNETTETDYLTNLFAIFWETVRVTKSIGTIVYNIGDKYQQGGLSLIPYKFAIQAIESQKVFLINDLTWVKLNPTPRQDKRKLISSTEPFFIFAKSKDYYFDVDRFLIHLDEFNQKELKKPSSKLGAKYYKLIEDSELNPREKQHAKQDLAQAIEEVRNGKIVSFRMKIRGVHKLAYGGQPGGRNNQILKQGFSIIKIAGKKLKKDLIEAPVEMTQGNQHPAVYPQAIIQELILLLTPENAIVLDPFCGSGTTCIAAQLLRRNYIGIEINPTYLALAHQRLKEEKQLELFL